MIGARDYQSLAGSEGFVIQTSECGPSKEGSGPVGRCLGFGVPSLGGPVSGVAYDEGCSTLGCTLEPCLWKLPHKDKLEECAHPVSGSIVYRDDG